jgi:hypothetical protein
MSIEAMLTVADQNSDVGTGDGQTAEPANGELPVQSWRSVMAMPSIRRRTQQPVRLLLDALDQSCQDITSEDSLACRNGELAVESGGKAEFGTGPAAQPGSDH